MSVVTDVSIVRLTIKPISRIPTLNLFIGNLMIDDKHATRTRDAFLFAFFALKILGLVDLRDLLHVSPPSPVPEAGVWMGFYSCLVLPL